MAKQRSKKHPFSADRPISKIKEDKLGRKSFVQGLSKAIHNWNGERSLVLAVYGGWGDGKTSVKEMMCDDLRNRAKDGLIITEFNPWEWSGQNQIAGAFFEDLSKQIGHEGKTSKAKDAAQRMSLLGKLLITGGNWLEPFATVANISETQL